MNIEVALAMEERVRAAGAHPATIGICRGQVIVGMSHEQIERLATVSDVVKASSRDIAPVAAGGGDGATTVAGTVACAHAAGIAVMATGGIGGVHRGFEQSGDISADIAALARHAVAVVASGAKSILDLPRTLEALEAAGVSVVGFGTDQFPAFYYRNSGLTVSHRLADVDAAARLVGWHRRLDDAGVLIANPVARESALDRAWLESLLDEALRAAKLAGVEGKAVTPFLLRHLAGASGGATLVTNQVLLKDNASLAGQIAARCAAA